ncbi:MULTISPECIES: SAF domain-containing protein [Paenibacillus]|uniref:SAF domain-containing protein n=1 Tax=Paenibacillus vandeheii TaxID=3035917 RepID=A0ABT8JFV8_9BACL|nr:MULTISPECIES: SAF domain-containing protein [Paenibacillus]KGP77788.1 hypothetical protein P364_0131480 [Paenibacillus sp. MAEPY2]KGP79565.1 hypothetical protein P363_0131035 [Paenibacillus sp. MAEPY1]MDN4603985.1 SAF domain-containing protein [Paenibacillus vandeheii]
MNKRRLLAVMMSAIVVIGFVGISEYRVRTELKSTVVYFAKQDIPAHTEITESMLEAIDLPLKGLPPGIIYNKKDIVGKYTQVQYGLAQNSYFFQSKIVTQDELMDAARLKLHDGQVLWTGSVNLVEASAGNVLPDTDVDVWFSAVETEGMDSKWVIGKMYEGVRVVSAKNKKAEDIVTKNTTNTVNSNGETTAPKKELYPTVVQLAVEDEQYQMLTASLSNAFKDGNIILVPHNKDAKAGIPELGVTGEFDIKPYIKSKQLNLSDFIAKNKESAASGTGVTITSTETLADILPKNTNQTKGEEN